MKPLVKGRILMASRTQAKMLNDGMLSLVIIMRFFAKQSCPKAFQLQATESYTVVHGAPCSYAPNFESRYRGGCLIPVSCPASLGMPTSSRAILGNRMVLYCTSGVSMY